MGSTYKYKPEHEKSNRGRKRKPLNIRKVTQSVCLHPDDWNEVKQMASEIGGNYTNLIELALKYYSILSYAKKLELKKLKNKTIKQIKENLDEKFKDN